MKSVKLNTEYIKKNKRGNYTVSVGNYNKRGKLKEYHFTTLQEAKFFLTKTNRFFTDCLLEINLLFAKTFTEYRITWSISISSEDERKINDRLDVCSENFSKIFSIIRLPNKNRGSLTFEALLINCKFLAEIVEILILESHKSTNTSGLYNYTFLLNDILRIKNALLSYNVNTVLKHRPCLN